MSPSRSTSARARGSQHLAHRVPHDRRVRQVVDVLARAGDVHELRVVGEAERGQVPADEHLDALDVVLAHGLELGELVDRGLIEVGHEPAQPGLLRVVHRVRAEQALVGEEDQPLDLDVHAGAVQPGLAEVFAERAHCLPVSAVEWAEGLMVEGAHVLSCVVACRRGCVRAAGRPLDSSRMAGGLPGAPR
jgi:hypothetical protein